MALTNWRVQLARPMVGSGVAERSVFDSCLMTIPMIGSCVVQNAYTVDASVAEFGIPVCTWKSGRLNQIVDVPVPQIEKERVEANQVVHQERVEANQLEGTSGTYSATHQRAELHCVERYSEPLL